MSWKKFFRRRRRDEDFSQELEAHLLHEIDRNVGLGLPSNEARAAALRKFGNITSTKEKVHEMNTISIIETSLQDLRHGGRLLWQNKTFAAVAILSLALGMGANTAIFQLLDAVRLRALPVMKPQELAEVQIVAKGGRTGSFISRRPTLTYPLLEQIRARQQSFSDLIAWEPLGSISIRAVKCAELKGYGSAEVSFESSEFPRFMDEYSPLRTTCGDAPTSEQSSVMVSGSASLAANLQPSAVRSCWMDDLSRSRE